MPHQHFCDVAAHHWTCSCDRICICGLPYEQAGHDRCPVELRACDRHEEEHLSASALPLPPGVVPITFPAELERTLRRATRSRRPPAAICIWCGHRYRRYSTQLEAEHFANHCSDAPQELQEHCKQRLQAPVLEQTKKTQNRRARCCRS